MAVPKAQDMVRLRHVGDMREVTTWHAAEDLGLASGTVGFNPAAGPVVSRAHSRVLGNFG